MNAERAVSIVLAVAAISFLAAAGIGTSSDCEYAAAPYTGAEVETYRIDLLGGAGYTIDPFPKTLGYSAEHGSDYSFEVCLMPGYEGTPIVEANGDPITAADGIVYTIEDVMENVTVTVVSGIVPEDVTDANTEDEDSGGKGIGMIGYAAAAGALIAVISIIVILRSRA